MCCVRWFSTKKKLKHVEPNSTSEVATVGETKFFEVTPSLKSVFDNTDEPFSLFGGNTDARDQSAACDEDDGGGDGDTDDEDAGEIQKTHCFREPGRLLVGCLSPFVPGLCIVMTGQNFISSFTPSHHIFVGNPISLVLSATIVIQLASSLHSPCPSQST